MALHGDPNDISMASLLSREADGTISDADAKLLRVLKRSDAQAKVDSRARPRIGQPRRPKAPTGLHEVSRTPVQKGGGISHQEILDDIATGNFREGQCPLELN